jgi:hypothetical protein
VPEPETPGDPFFDEQLISRSPQVRVSSPSAIKINAKRIALTDVPAFFEQQDRLFTAPTEWTATEQPKPGEVEIDFSPLLNNGKGIVAVRLGDGEDRPIRLHAFSELSPLLKIGSQRGLVWVTRVTDGKPVANAEVKVVRCQQIARGRTNADGLFEFRIKKTRASCRADYALVKLGDDESFVSDSDSGIEEWYASVGPNDLGIPAEGGYAPGDYALLMLDRRWYRPGERARFYGITRHTQGSQAKPLQGKVRIISEFEHKRGPTLTLPVSDEGMFSGEIELPNSFVAVENPSMMLLHVELDNKKLGGTGAFYASVPYEPESSPKTGSEPLPTFAPTPPEESAQAEEEWRKRPAPYLSIEPDKPNYEVGDVAHVRVASQFSDAYALLTMEEFDVLSARVQRLQGRISTVDVPLGADLAPTSTLSVALSNAEVPAGEPGLVFDVMRLMVGGGKYRLTVHATVEKDGKTARVLVEDAEGRPVSADLIVHMNDEIFWLETRDPWVELFRRPYTIVTADPRFLRTGCQEVPPMDEGLPPEEPAPSPADGALMFARAHTDDTGVAMIPLPARPTMQHHYRLYVTAAARDGAVGTELLMLY